MRASVRWRQAGGEPAPCGGTGKPARQPWRRGERGGEAHVGSAHGCAAIAAQASGARVCERERAAVEQQQQRVEERGSTQRLTWPVLSTANAWR